MASFEQFELCEPFIQSNIERLPNSLRLDKSIKDEGKLYRLLIGTLDIKNNITGEVIKQKSNYSVLGKKERNKFSLRLFTDPLSPTATISDLDLHLTSGNPSNIVLFKDLINEYCSFYYYKAKNIDTLAYLHVYRILERMSYTFPMMYASKATDYVGTFNKLQNFFKGSNSELKFFNLFIEDFFEEEFLEYKVKINITAYNQDIKESYYRILKMLCSSNDPVITLTDFNEFSDITFENRNTINLLIHLRNRYFHFASGGQRNIKSSEMIEPNDFYRILNEHFVNWLAVVYFKIAKSSIR
ncbi:hypothetical protein EWM62_18900 [Mucilaginibacter terrigena]|uniref:Uncharacterized protein n=1 Tax=Mucilaginibacter terrigena TaxID=2492395 RepID=A0A4V1ZBC8_9SPHI|nr:hypothetical protein [Mucilaginibacter terrigena]RYU85906.1 hypothetical protein EWM62_18900 [Mucilaginibacter terrigena]